MNDEKETQTFQVFCSYSHEDKDYQDSLAKHLAALRRVGVIELWYDKEIRAGDKWSDEISESLEKADIILLLVSANFISSDYCFTIELKRAIELHESRQATAIPIIIKPCDWHIITSLAELQALPEKGRPVSSWSQQDEAWTDVSKGIRNTIEKLKLERIEESRQPVQIQKFRSLDTNFTKNLLFSFLKTWSRWSFNIARIQGWGARQPGYEEFSDFDTNSLKRALKELKDEGKIVSYTSSKTGNIMYKYKK